MKLTPLPLDSPCTGCDAKVKKGTLVIRRGKNVVALCVPCAETLALATWTERVKNIEDVENAERRSYISRRRERLLGIQPTS